MTLSSLSLAHEHPAISEYHKRAELPLDFERRRVSVLVGGPEGTLVVTKGAPEGVLVCCSSVERNGAEVPFTGEMQAEARRTYAELSRAGFHVLAIARKSASPDQETLAAVDERNLVLCGFVAFLDPPAPTAIATVAALASSGVSMKILTGDGELVTRTICERVGLRTDRVVLGVEVESMSHDALGAIVEQVDIFGRVSPAQKNRTIRALKRRKHVVGYMG